MHLDQQKIDCEQSGQAVQSCKTQQQPMVMMEQVGTSSTTGKRPTTTVLLFVREVVSGGDVIGFMGQSLMGFRQQEPDSVLVGAK